MYLQVQKIHSLMYKAFSSLNFINLTTVINIFDLSYPTNRKHESSTKHYSLRYSVYFYFRIHNWDYIINFTQCLSLLPSISIPYSNTWDYIDTIISTGMRGRIFDSIFKEIDWPFYLLWTPTIKQKCSITYHVSIHPYIHQDTSKALQCLSIWPFSYYLIYLIVRKQL